MVRALTLPVGVQEKTFFDDDIPGFGVRVRIGGTRRYVVQYKVAGKHRRVVLGAVSSLDLSKARQTAKDLLAAVRLGRDPAGEKLAQQQKFAETFGALLPRFLARQRQRLKPRSYQESERHLLGHAKSLHSYPVQVIDRRAVALLLAEIAERRGPAAANRTRASLSAFFVWLAREGLIEANPVAFTNKAVERGARLRVLGDAELAAIWRACGDDQYSSIIRLLILTGARRDEIGGLAWSEIDLDAALITLPGGRTKNRREHQIPLAERALAIIQSQPRRLQSDGSPRDHIFGHGDGRGWQDWSGSKQDLDARITAARSQSISDWRLHDFRRTLSTVMHERLGVLPHVVEAVLGHVDGHLRGVAGVYNKSTYTEQKRMALALWADHVQGVCDDGAMAQP
jgi:integrase